MISISDGDAKVQEGDYNTVLTNCIATAANNYTNGDIGIQLYRDFVYQHCHVINVSF